MEFRVLGPLQIHTGHGPVQLAGSRMRKMLAVLLVNHDTTVPLDYLIDAVWDEEPPPTAKRQLQNSVSALRRLLNTQPAAPGDTVIVADGSGYRIRVAPGDLDVQVFTDRAAKARRYAADGQLTAAVAEARAALGLWRGPALSGLGGRIIESSAARLDEQRIAVTEEWVELELLLGNHSGLIGELSQLVAAYPARERLVGQLMLALYRDGRQAEALRAYDRSRRLLSEELGLDPGPHLRKLHAAILGSDPALDAPGDPVSTSHTGHPVPAQLPADTAHFAGRAACLKEMDELLSGDATAVAVAVIAGMAGSGKTALAVHWAHLVADRFPDGHLHVNLRGFNPAGAAMSPAEAVRVLLDGLAVPPEQIPASLDAQVGLYRSLLTGRRTLIVLDNARDAEQIRPLLPGAPGCLVLVTSRDQMSGLVAATGARPIPLDLLGQDEARQLLAGRLGPARTAAEPGAVDEIIVRCGRLPLALAIVAARAATYRGFPLTTLAGELRDTGGSLDAFTGGDAATDVRAVFSWSYHQLGEPAARLFRRLGLHPGPDITVRAAASLAGVPESLARPQVAELTRAHLVTEPVPGRYALHDLLRAYAIELSSTLDSEADRHAATHRLLDYYLHTAYAADRLLDPHRDPIALTPPRPGATPGHLGDQGQAQDWLTAELAVLRAAVEHATRVGFDRHAWQLAATLAHFFERRGHWHQWIATNSTALAAAQRLPDPRGQAPTRRGLGRAYIHLGQVDEARAQLGRAADLYRDMADHAGQARIHFDLCWLAHRQGQYQDGLRHAQLALDLFRTAGNPSGTARALTNVGWGHTSLGDHGQALAHFQQALALLKDIDDLFGAADAWDGLGQAHHGLGQHAESITCYESALGLCRELGDRYREGDTLVHLGDAHQAAGDPDAARRGWQRALTILDELDHPDAAEVRGRLT